MAERETIVFRANVAAICEEHGAVQAVATKAKITRVYLSKIIHGHATPSLDIAAKISEAVGIPLARMISRPLAKRILERAS